MSHRDCLRPFLRSLRLSLFLIALVGFGTSAQSAEPQATDSKPAEPAAAKSPATEPAATTPAAATPMSTTPAAAEPPAAEPPAAEPPAAKPATAQPAPAKPKLPEPKLRFNFRYQRWSDVLEWFADQADLSLVLDAPPPGTFNYTDSRTYSSTEAIDLLNSVLLTKGFTLIRRERMLMVLDLRGGVPEGTIPSVTLEELDKHGKFELVSTMFPLEGRDAQAVNDEISVLLGPYGRSVPLPQTKQILVTDRAGIMPTIGRMIESMPTPPQKPAPPKPPVPEKPELRVYPVKSVEPQSVIDVVNILVPGIKIVADPKTHKLSAYAAPSQHGVLKSVLEQMQADNAPSLRPKLKVYPLNVAGLTTKDLQDLEATFELIVPMARLRIDSEGGKLVAWATTQDHEILDAALKQIGRDSLLPETRQLAVYRLTRADPESTLSLLKSLLPKATLVIDSQTGSLVAVATPNDHKAIASILEELQPKEPSADAPQLQIYTIEQTLPESVSDLFAKLLPQADITVDNEDKRVMAVATPADQKVIQSTLDDLQKTAAGNEPYELTVYQIVPSQLGRVKAVLETLVPTSDASPDGTTPSTISSSRLSRYSSSQLAKFRARGLLPPAGTSGGNTAAPELVGVKIVPDENRGELAIWARPRQHKIISEIIAELKKDTTEYEEPELRAYPITAADPDSLVTMLETAYPDAKIVLDEVGQRLLVWTQPATHASIKANLEEIAKAKPAEEAYQLVVYRVAPTQLERIKAVLDALTGTASDTTGSATSRRTRSKYSHLSSSQLEKLRARGYPVDEEPKTARAVAQELTGIRMVADAERGTLAIWAKPSQHTFIASIIDELKSETSESELAQVMAYPIPTGDPNIVLSLLETLYPTAKLGLDAETRRVLAWAPSAMQESIKVSVEQMLAGAAETAKQAKVYHLTKAVPADVTTILSHLVPNAETTVNEKEKQLVVIATPAEHTLIQQTIDELETSLPEKEKRTLVVYRVPPQQFERAHVVLGVSASSEQSDEDRLHALGYSSSQLARLSSSQLAKLKSRYLPSGKPSAVGTSTIPGLEDIKIFPDPERGELAIWATASQHRLITEIVDAVKQGGGNDEQRQLVTYPIKMADPQSVLSMLETLYIDTKFVLDEENHRLIAWTDPKTQASIKAALEQMQVDKPGEDQPRFESYPLYGADASNLMTTLQSLLPNVRISVDTTGTRLIAWGTPLEQTQLKAALQELQQGQTPATTKQLEVYHLTKADPSTTLQLLEKLLPNAQMFLDSQTRSLIALAVPVDQQIIRATLEQLQPTQPGPDAPQLRFYPLTKALPANVMTILSHLVPDAQVTVDQEGKQLMVVAAAADHLIVKSTLEEVEKALPDAEERQLIVYPVTPAQRKRFDAVLSTMTSELPGITIIKDAEPGELSIWAKPSQHTVIAEIVSELQRDVPETEKYQLVAYPLKAVDPETATSLLESVFPETKIVVDEDTNRLLIWTRPADHARIKAALEQLDSGQPVDRTEGFMVYPVKDTDAQVALQVLQELLPKVNFVQDHTAGTIIAWAKKKDHELITRTLEKLQAGLDEKYKPKLEVYSVGTADATAISTFLQTAVPDARITVDTTTGVLMAWAIPADQETIRATVEKMSEQTGGAGSSRFVVYTLKSTGAANAYTILRNAFPRMQFTYSSSDGARLIAWGSAADQELVRQVVDQLEDDLAQREGLELKVYDVTTLGAREATQVLAAVVPKVTFTTGTDPNRLIAWAKPEDHALVADVLKQLADENLKQGDREMQVYSLTKADPLSASQILQDSIPGAKFINDRRAGTIVAWANKDDHEKIVALLAKLDAGPDEQHKPTLEIYPLGKADGTTVSQFLQYVAPTARISVDTKTGRLMVWATPAEHETIRTTVERMVEQAASQVAPQVMVYDMPSLGAVSGYNLMRSAFPRMQFSYSSDRTKLIAWGPANEQKLIKQIIEQLEQDASLREGVELKVYDVKSVGARSAQQMLGDAIPKAKFTTTADPNKLIAWADLEDHARIEEILKVLPEAPEMTSKVYRLEHANLSAAYSALRSLVPQATVAMDTINNALVVSALPDDHVKIQATVTEMDREDVAHSPQLVVYPVDNADATTISTFLRSVVPNARVSVDTNTGNLMAWATPAEHVTIRSTIDEIVKQAGDGGAGVVIYDVTRTGAKGAYYILRYAFPNMRFSYSTRDDTKLVAWGSAKDQGDVVELVKQLEDEASQQAGYEVKTYDVEAIGASRAESMLEEVAPKATFTSGSDPDTLIVWASPEEHVLIGQLVSQLPPVPQTVAHVYRLEHADVSAVYSALRSLVPKAVVAMDRANSSVVVSALPDDQEKIAATIQELDSQDAENGPQFVVYPVQNSDPSTIADFLGNAVPNARITVDEDSSNLMVWATPTEHATIKAAVDEMTRQAGEAGAKVVVYDVSGTGARSAYYVLRYAFPRSHFNYSTHDDSKLVAWGPEKDLEMAQQIIDQLEDDSLLKSGLVLKVYDVQGLGAKEAEDMLENIVPRANFTTGRDPNKLIVWAKPEDHTVIEQTVKDLPPLPETISRVYYLRRTDPEAAQSVLSAMVPLAEMAVDEENRSLVVNATAEDHAKLKTAIDEMDQERADAPTPRVEIHPFTIADPLDIYTALRALYRYRKDIQLSLDANNDTLLAVAPPDDQQRIHDLISTVEAAGTALRKDMTVKVYDVESVGATNARELLRRAVPKAELTTGGDPDKLIVRAKAQDHVLIEQIIEELPSLPETTSRVYYLRKADPEAALSVLETLTPDAEIAVDDENRSLIVSATAEDHAKLESAVSELEREHPNDPSPRVETYRMKTADAYSIYNVLRSLYKKRDDVQLSIDQLNDTLIAIAPAEDHAKIRELIDRVEQAGTTEGPEKIEFYSMENMDADAVLALVEELLKEQGSKAHVSLAPRSEQLIVMARPEIQEMIQEALEGFQTEEPILEVYQLELIDPFTAELAIGRLFGTEGTQPAPIVDSDTTTQRLFVRATEEQQTNIRDLLVKMGETGLTVRRGETAANARLRVVPFDGDSAQAIEEIKQIWSQLRSNPIQVIVPSSIPLQKPTAGSGNDSGPRESSPSEQTPEPSVPKPSATEPRDGHSSTSAFDFNTALAEVGMSDTGLAIGQPQEPLNGKAAEPQMASPDAGAPVVVVPGADSVTITCDDPEALSQFENLLRALSGHTGLIGRNLIVLSLRNVAATTVADTLNHLFREDETGFGISTGPVTVVPDERLNAVIVHANRADRATIRSLVQVLDTAEIPDSQAIKRPMLIPVKNTDAERIEDVLRTIYKTHLTASSGRGRSMPIPQGIPSKLASALQQMNATTTGPLMAIAIEEKSNSLVVMAPSRLLEEVRSLVEELDRVAINENSRRIAIIPLKKVDTSRLQQALDLFHRGGTRSRSRSSRSRSSK